ncbi:MAG: hypothetical protein DRR19_05750 [Candidatus Parabeggiatoa sp. nov. 1]|nr:MAG: hypothetical protein DRR19_05750 [Gammaproteobacteria bacterium]
MPATSHYLKVKFGLQRTFDEPFFPEWQPAAKLPKMTEFDKRFLDRAKEAYFNLIEYPHCWKIPLKWPC